MFKNFKAIAHMRSPVATIDYIILDAIVSAAKAKEILGEEFYSGKNIAGEREDIERMLDPIIDKQYGVYCTSIGIGDNREYVGSWAKRWDDKNDDMVDFGGKGKERIDIGAGTFKNYHMPLVLKSYKTITFYVRGDMEEISRLLETYISYLGKKGSQGYGHINKWEFEEIAMNYSIFNDGQIMRPVPVDKCQDYLEHMFKKQQSINIMQHATIPPYWRKEKELCVIPN